MASTKSGASDRHARADVHAPGDDCWHSAVEPALQVEDAEAVSWDVEADFVVVGFGGAGVAAALQAREDGVDVVALDRGEGGGTTVASGGVYYAGGGTRVQRELGEEDTPEDMFAYLRGETQGVVSDSTLKRFCNGSAGDVDWLLRHGVPFGGPVWKEKTSYPNVEYFLYHSDNSLLPASSEVARPAARGHRGRMARGRSAVNLGGSIYGPLRSAALRAGIRLERKTEARQLVLDGNRRAVGVRALQLPAATDAYAEHSSRLRRGNRLAQRYPPVLPGAGPVHWLANRHFARVAEIERTARVWRSFRARRGVCLSAGGFVFNRPMMESHCPRFAAGMALGTAGDDGSGIRLGQSAGGAVDRMDRATAWRFINPPAAWSRGVIVDARGSRIVNESAYGATIGDAIVEHSAGKAWLILDSRLVREAWREIGPGKVLPFQRQLAALSMLFGKRKASGLASVCRQFGFEEATLRATLADYGRAARGAMEDPWRKPVEDIRELRPPFHVMDISLDARLMPCPVLTVGGLVVNEDTGEVRRDDGTEISRLYAAGRTAVGLPSHLYVSGLSIADCVFSGRRAGRHAAARDQV